MNMDDKLKHLRKSMDQTVFKNHALTPYDKLDIKNYVLSSKRKKERYYKYTMFTLTLSVTCVFLLVMGIYLNGKVEQLEKQVTDAVQAEQEGSENKPITLNFAIKSGGGVYLPGFEISNYAVGNIGLDEYKIYAGTVVDDPSTGFLYLVINKGKGNTTKIQYSFAKGAPLKIMAIEGQELVLSAQGNRIYFDVPNRNVYYGSKRQLYNH
ncbi:hypothetical protein ACLM5H_03305 [Fredinandcohnia humi]